MQGRLPMHRSPRCGARTRNGTPCRSPAMKNGRCGSRRNIARARPVTQMPGSTAYTRPTPSRSGGNWRHSSVPCAGLPRTASLAHLIHNQKFRLCASRGIPCYRLAATSHPQETSARGSKDAPLTAPCRAVPRPKRGGELGNGKKILPPSSSSWIMHAWGVFPAIFRHPRNAPRAATLSRGAREFSRFSSGALRVASSSDVR